MNKRIYIDSSVIGGCKDEEFSEWSNELFTEFEKGLKTAVISDLTREEIEKAPDEVKQVLNSLSDSAIEDVFLTEQAEELAEKYIENKVVDEMHISDAQHIAIATIENADVLVSWNFKHIVNINKIQGFNSVNLKLGYQALEIRTPREVLENEKEI